MIIDATDLKVGRISTVAAKAALRGEDVKIVNCEKAVFTGNKRSIVEKYRGHRQRGGPHWGPFQPRMSDRFFRRIVKGMLPMSTARGKDAFKRIMCYIGNPLNEKAETIKDAHISNSETLRYVTVEEVCRELGGNA